MIQYYAIINSLACNAQTFDTLTKAAMVFANFISKFGEIHKSTGTLFLNYAAHMYIVLLSDTPSAFIIHIFCRQSLRSTTFDVA